MKLERSIVPSMMLLLFCSPALAQSAGEIRLSAREAVERALKHNLDLKYERLAPELSTAPERSADAPFDPMLTAGIDYSRSPGQVSSQRAGLTPVASNGIGGEIGLRKSFGTGTSVEMSLTSEGLFASGGQGSGLDPGYQSGLRLSGRQNLLEGFNRSANLLGLTSARINREVAKRGLIRSAELVGAATLKAYWDLHAARAKLKVQDLALKMSEKTLADTEALIRAGTLSASESISATYAVQSQQRDRVAMAKSVSDARDRLARLMGLVEPGSIATPRLVTMLGPRPKPWRVTRVQLQKLALQRRGDYLALLEQLKLRRAERDAAGHRTLPKLDLVAALSFNGLSGTAADPKNQGDFSTGYWSSYKMKRIGFSAGLLFELPLLGRKKKAEAEIAELKVQRAKVAKQRAVRELSLQLNVAWRAVDVARRQLALTKAAAKAAATKLKNEEARFLAGKITAHILATVQAEVIKERLAKE